MATTIYCKDGTREVLHGRPVDSLRRLVEDHIGCDAVALIDDLDEEREQLERTALKCERAADGYYGALKALQQELYEIMEALDAPRLNRAKLRQRVSAAYHDIYDNI